jgi:desampylase
MGVTLAVSRSVLIGIRRISADLAPHEACGLLFGAGDAVTAFQATENVAETPERRFEIEPAALFAALRAERGGGPMLAGYWHSHPGGRAEPSATDRAMAAADGRLWLIVAGAAVTAWRAMPNGGATRFEPQAIIATDP